MATTVKHKSSLDTARRTWRDVLLEVLLVGLTGVFAFLLLPALILLALYQMGLLNQAIPTLLAGVFWGLMIVAWVTLFRLVRANRRDQLRLFQED